MTPNDYLTLLSRAVASIDRDSYAARFAIYDREHKALLRRLATADLPCSDADVTREEQAFRDAVRCIEFEEYAEPTLVPQDEPIEEPPPRREPAWPQAHSAQAGPMELHSAAVRPEDVRPTELRPMEVEDAPAREDFAESELPGIEPSEPGLAIEPPDPLSLIPISEPRSVARRLAERMALAVVILAMVGTAAWMLDGDQDVTGASSLQSAAEPAAPAAPDDLTAAKAQQPTWLSPEILYTMPPAPSSPTPGPALASAPRADIPLPLPRPDH
jgi:hypothetical protein